MSNDLTWDQITEEEELQDILNAIWNSEFKVQNKSAERLIEWLDNNVAQCAAEVFAGVRYYPDGSGQPPEGCDNPVAPGCGEFCSEHREEE